jgi:hypothetical protein
LGPFLSGAPTPPESVFRAVKPAAPLGYNRQLGNVVFGVEGDLDWSGYNGSRTTAGCPIGCSTSDSWLSTVRGRIGYSFDRVMPFMSPAVSPSATFAPRRPALPAARHQCWLDARRRP